MFPGPSVLCRHTFTEGSQNLWIDKREDKTSQVLNFIAARLSVSHILYKVDKKKHPLVVGLARTLVRWGAGSQSLMSSNDAAGILWKGNKFDSQALGRGKRRTWAFLSLEVVTGISSTSPHNATPVHLLSGFRGRRERSERVYQHVERIIQTSGW